MIVTNANIVYVCTNCKVPYTFKFALKTAASPTDVAKHMPNIKECTICKRDMNIKHAIFKTIDANDEYGDDAFGSWRCPSHTSVVYYPNLMKQVANGTLSVAGMGQVLYNRYLKLVAMKYPWRCPLCAESLKYRMDKYACVG